MGGQAHHLAPPVVARRLAHDEPVGFEPAEDPAEVAGVEPQQPAQLGRGHLIAMRQLEQHAGLGERVRRAEDTGLEHADHARVEAVELAYARHRFRHRRPSEEA
jgi:hypothetical protein